MKRVEPDEPPALFFPQECEHVPTERSVGSLFQRARSWAFGESNGGA